MANDITVSPLVIDTASGTAITTKTFVANMIRWVSASAAAGDTVSVQNNAGNIKWATVATGSNYVEESHFERKPLIFEGLKVPTLASGTIYIYVDSPIPIPT